MGHQEDKALSVLQNARKEVSNWGDEAPADESHSAQEITGEILTVEIPAGSEPSAPSAETEAKFESSHAEAPAESVDQALVPGDCRVTIEVAPEQQQLLPTQLVMQTDSTRGSWTPQVVAPRAYRKPKRKNCGCKMFIVVLIIAFIAGGTFLYMRRDDLVKSLSGKSKSAPVDEAQAQCLDILGLEPGSYMALDFSKVLERRYASGLDWSSVLKFIQPLSDNGMEPHDILATMGYNTAMFEQRRQPRNR